MSRPWTIPTPSAADPGRACGTTSSYPRPALCRCGHMAEVHAISDRTKQRAACSVADPDKCGCRKYEEATT